MDKVFEKGLGVEDPWFVHQITFNKEANWLDVDIDSFVEENMLYFS
jgi:hypothetical protein